MLGGESGGARSGRSRLVRLLACANANRRALPRMRADMVRIMSPLRPAQPLAAPAACVARADASFLFWPAWALGVGSRTADSLLGASSDLVFAQASCSPSRRRAARTPTTHTQARHDATNPPIRAQTRKHRARPRSKRACRARAGRDVAGVADWQIALRRQFGREQKFRLREPRRRAGLLRVRGDQSADRADAIAWRSAARRWARTSAPAPTSPSTRWAPASTSSSRWPGWAQARRQGGPGRGLPAGLFARSTCTTARSARCVFRPGTRLPGGAARLGRQRYFDAEGRLRARGASPRFDDVPARGRRQSATSCAATTTPWRFIAEVRDARAAAAPDRSRPFREASRSAALQGPAEGAALSLPARRGPVRRPGRPLPDRRRHGPGQDDPGHRRRRDPRPPLSASSACWSSAHLAEAPVGAARSRSSPAARRWWSRGLRRAARTATRPSRFYKITNYDVVHRDLDADRALAARPGHPRRGPADQELEDAGRPGRQAARSRRTPSC